ncbi:MAG: helix-turn-helix domain-containing protein [Candidatus Binatus sp.]|uniref:helix-turn-helix domain-containing protein n=1 Tax=Candidatus Binatus sp. TaxID=2811406 RepID=UPI0027214B0C|nr:helix-turn-helix domain-containing protein [Candidatus Binatus sp.]MDO8433496.1 helix-turn-helix domain-containing protein [Candidatus Binatus sp.]
MADKKSDTTPENPEAIAAAPDRDQPLSQILTQARERRGLTRDQVVADAHVPLLYLKMIETDDYGLISDRLYLIPFLRKYAAFLGLEPEEIASRFVRDMQHAESNVVRMSEPITMVTKRRGVLRSITFVVLALLVLILIGDFVWRRFTVVRETIEPAASAPIAATPAPLTILPTVIPAAPAAIPTLAPPTPRPTATFSRPAGRAIAPSRKVPAFDD